MTIPSLRSIRDRIRGALRPYDVRYTRVIERMHLAACVPCQYDCVDCSHAAMRYQFSGYQLNLDDLREFLRVTEQSGYLIKWIDLTGPGEPLLWRHLKEGLRLLRASPAIERIQVVTNGLALDRLDDEDWDNLDRLDFSMYPENRNAEDDLAALGRHRAKVTIRDKQTFKAAPKPGETAPVPCNCQCTGPMYFNRQVFFYCGPTVFGAAATKGVDVTSYPEMFGPIGPDYLRPSRPPATRLVHRLPIVRRLFPVIDPEVRSADHELCRYCFANSNRQPEKHAHVAYIKPRSRRT